MERATVRTTLTPLGRARSALPGSAVDGIEAPTLATTMPAASYLPQSHPGRMSAPAGGIFFDPHSFTTLLIPALISAPSRLPGSGLPGVLAVTKVQGCGWFGGGLIPVAELLVAVPWDGGGCRPRSGGVEGGAKREADYPAATVVARGRGPGGAGRRQERRPSPRARAGPPGGPVGCDP